MSNPANLLKNFWNARYKKSGFRFGIEPNEYLVQQCKDIPFNGKALCLADGEGRNGVWLAKQGFNVTSVDISSEGMAKAKKLADEQGVSIQFDVADIKFYPFELQEFDLVVSIFFHTPSLLRQEIHQKVIKSLKPGGTFILESYAPAQISQRTGGPKEVELLLNLTDVLKDFSTCIVKHQFSGTRIVIEGDAHQGNAYVTQLTVKKPI